MALPFLGVALTGGTVLTAVAKVGFTALNAAKNIAFQAAKMGMHLFTKGAQATQRFLSTSFTTR